MENSTDSIGVDIARLLTEWANGNFK